MLLCVSVLLCVSERCCALVSFCKFSKHWTKCCILRFCPFPPGSTLPVALRSSWIAISSPVICYFPRFWQFRPLFFDISPSRAAKWQFQPLYFAIFSKNSNPAPSVLPFHPPAGLNSNNHHSVLPVSQILAILTIVFAICPSGK